MSTITPPVKLLYSEVAYPFRLAMARPYPGEGGRAQCTALRSRHSPDTSDPEGPMDLAYRCVLPSPSRYAIHKVDIPPEGCRYPHGYAPFVEGSRRQTCVMAVAKTCYYGCNSSRPGVTQTACRGPSSCGCFENSGCLGGFCPSNIPLPSNSTHPSITIRRPSDAT